MYLVLLIQCCQSDLFNLEFQYLEVLLRTKMLQLCSFTDIATFHYTFFLYSM